MSVLTLVSKQNGVGLYMNSKKDYYVQTENVDMFQKCKDENNKIIDMVEFLSDWYAIGNRNFIYEDTIYDDKNYTVYNINGRFTAIPKSTFGRVIAASLGNNDMKKIEDIIGPYLSDKYKILSDATLYEILLRRGQTGYLCSGEHTIEWKHA